VRSGSGNSPIEDPLNFLAKAIVKLYSIWVSVFYPFASKGDKFSLHFTCQISRRRSRRISLGRSVSLRDHVWLNPADSNSEGEPLIVIDDNCAVGSNTIISAKNLIRLERDVLVGQFVLIQDHNHAYEDPTIPIVDQGITEGGTIRIGQGSWIGRGSAIICPKGELIIGEHSVVGANSVVLRSIPPYCVVFGAPARVVRQFDPVRRTWVIGSNQDPVAID
jgi:acetyltransferase-like isoleucine patch superfamily enzyme